MNNLLFKALGFKEKFKFVTTLIVGSGGASLFLFAILSNTFAAPSAPVAAAAAPAPAPALSASPHHSESLSMELLSTLKSAAVSRST
jgi:hypothetical protein